LSEAVKWRNMKIKVGDEDVWLGYLQFTVLKLIQDNPNITDREILSVMCRVNQCRAARTALYQLLYYGLIDRDIVKGGFRVTEKGEKVIREVERRLEVRRWLEAEYRELYKKLEELLAKLGVAVEEVEG